MWQVAFKIPRRELQLEHLRRESKAVQHPLGLKGLFYTYQPLFISRPEKFVVPQVRTRFGVDELFLLPIGKSWCFIKVLAVPGPDLGSPSLRGGIFTTVGHSTHSPAEFLSFLACAEVGEAITYY